MAHATDAFIRESRASTRVDPLPALAFQPSVQLNPHGHASEGREPSHTLAPRGCASAVARLHNGAVLGLALAEVRRELSGSAGSPADRAGKEGHSKLVERHALLLGGRSQLDVQVAGKTDVEDADSGRGPWHRRKSRSTSARMTP